MSNKFRWGVLGPGRIANNFAQGVEVLDNSEIYAVGSRNIERSESFRQQYNCTKAFGSYEELINDPEVDGIYISTPHRFHFEQIKLTLNAGKPVLCEKPLTVNAKQAEEVIELAKSKNLFLMEALWTRYLPIYSQVRQWLDSGVIGEIKCLDSKLGFEFPQNYEDRLYNHELAGGVTLDLGVYPIAVSQWVTKQNPVSISVSGVVGKTNVDEITSVNMKYENGIISQHTSNLYSRTNNDFIIYGTKGKITVHDMFIKAERATLNTEGQELTITKKIKASGFEYEIEEAQNCIKAGKLESENMILADTLANMKVMDSIRNELGLRYSFE